jgi:TolB protein
LAAGRFPDFSPDGLRIVYSGSGIHIMDLDGTLQDSPRDSGDMPDWSPDGQYIVFRETRDIWIMNLDGSEATNLTQDGDNSSSASPRWSPDGESIAFERCQGAYCHILVMDRSGGNVRSLTHGEVSDFLPDWSPDGNWISFERYSESDNTMDLWIASRDGSIIKRVTTSGKASTAKWGRTVD